MKYDYAEMKITMPMDYFLDMFVGHYDAEKLDANVLLEEHKWYYYDTHWQYDDTIISMQDYIATLKDYHLSIWKLKTIIEDMTGDVIDNTFMENVVAFIMTLRFFGIEHINFRISMEIYNKINDACSILCEYCESDECECCMVSRLNNDAYTETVNDIVDSE